MQKKNLDLKMFLLKNIQNLLIKIIVKNKMAISF